MINYNYYANKAIKLIKENTRYSNEFILLGQASPNINKNAPKEFRELAKRKLQTPEISERLLSEVRTLLPIEDEQQRFSDYMFMADTFLVLDKHKAEIAKKFGEYLKTESSKDLLQMISTSEKIPSQLQQLAKQRLEAVTKSQSSKTK